MLMLICVPAFRVAMNVAENVFREELLKKK